MIEYISSEGDSSFSLAGVVSGPGRLVYVAGQVGVGPDGRLVDGGVAAEADATFDLIEQIMQRAGGQLSDLVRMGVYLTSLDGYGDFAEVRRRRFPDGLPASSAVQVAGLLLGASIEIDAIGFVTN